MTVMSERKVIQSLFPNLTATTFKVTSPCTPQYNCIAWAAEDCRQWWWPFPGKYWPPGVDRIETMDAFIQAFQTLGYVQCSNSLLEIGTQKIVLYANAQGAPTHAARQLEDGKWTSKLGKEWDISHHTPMGMSGKNYGQIAVYMKRVKPSP
jgi:hypothetical protein